MKWSLRIGVFLYSRLACNYQKWLPSLIPKSLFKYFLSFPTLPFYFNTPIQTLFPNSWHVSLLRDLKNDLYKEKFITEHNKLQRVTYLRKDHHLFFWMMSLRNKNLSAICSSLYSYLSIIRHGRKRDDGKFFWDSKYFLLKF